MIRQACDEWTIEAVALRLVGGQWSAELSLTQAGRRSVSFGLGEPHRTEAEAEQAAVTRAKQWISDHGAPADGKCAAGDPEPLEQPGSHWLVA
jgi:hypothetical protein